MRQRSIIAALFSALLVVAASAGIVVMAQQKAPARTQWPGAIGHGVTLLPNGWTLAPAGQHMTMGPLPLAMVQSPDGRYLIVSNDGGSHPSLTVVDLKNFQVKEKVNVEFAWLGLAWHPTERRLYSSAGAQNAIDEFSFARDRLTAGGAYPLGRPQSVATEHSFIGGVAVSPEANWLYAAEVLGKAVAVVDLKKGRVRQTIDLPAEAYSVLPSPDGKMLYVSLWGGAKVLVYDALTLEKRGEVAVGEHPNALVWSKDAKRLFVACANTNTVWVIDAEARTAREQISVALFPNAPPGATPNGLGLSPDGTRLLVANADNNTVAVVNVSDPQRSVVEGFIPTGWYPTAAQFSRDGSKVYVLSGKGLTSAPNPRGSQPGVPGSGDGQYTGGMLQGSLSILAAPDAATLAAMTKTVYSLTPMTSAGILAPAAAPAVSPIPRKVGDASPIKYVFYVIRENRTYDQILGDLDRGNGDPNLCLFGEDITPNAHAIAREFVVLDNFYVDAEVSYDGHAYSTGAYATDFVEKIWPTNYGGRGARYLSEGGGEMRNAYGNVTAPMNGYIWDSCVRAGLSVRSYGEFTELAPVPAGTAAAGRPQAAARVPGLVGRIHPTYPPWDLLIPDNKRVDAWLEEFRGFEQNGGLPRLNIVRLGGDHTAGTRAGYPTPRAMIAENDTALGRLVDAISHSVFWKESAIFVLEDDAQNGPDHVDAHRSPAFVISPFVRRTTVDSTMYSTSAMLRTMELILGLPPMSNYDAAATPMYNAFQAAPVLTPFTARPARIDVTEKNAATAWGAAASARMNMAEADLAPDLELNDIVWRSVRGAGHPMPPPVRAAFIRAVPADEDDDDGGTEKQPTG